MKRALLRATLGMASFLIMLGSLLAALAWLYGGP